MQTFTYSVDLALCIDATASMSPVIDSVKNSALTFYEDLDRVLKEKSKTVDAMRIRVVVFRDFYVDGTDSLLTTDFFQLPAASDDFAGFVKRIDAHGGGD